MFKKTTSGLLLFIIFTFSFQPVLAQRGDWSEVKKRVNFDIAVQKTNGEIIFGRLTSASDDELIVQIANKTDLTNTNSTISKAEIKKLWLATLRFDERNTVKGAIIGAGVGVAIGVAVVKSESSEGPDGQRVLAVPVITLLSAGAGAFLGFLSKKGHKKGKLIYSI